MPTVNEFCILDVDALIANQNMYVTSVSNVYGDVNDIMPKLNLQLAISNAAIVNN